MKNVEFNTTLKNEKDFDFQQLVGKEGFMHLKNKNRDTDVEKDKYV